jgi:hypothetical protein
MSSFYSNVEIVVGGYGPTSDEAPNLWVRFFNEVASPEKVTAIAGLLIDECSKAGIADNIFYNNVNLGEEDFDLPSIVVSFKDAVDQKTLEDVSKKVIAALPNERALATQELIAA